MNLIPWKNKQRELDFLSFPDLSLRRFRNEMDRLFDRFLGTPEAGGIEPFGLRALWKPAIDIAETEREITIRAELPGVDAKDLEVNLSGRTLSLSGEKRESKENRGENFHQVERRFGSFRRMIELPAEVDPDSVVAEHKHGVLHVTMRKTTASATRRVPIKVATD